MSESLWSASRGTHLKIVAVALVGAIVVVTVGIHARSPDTATAVAAIKAAHPASYTDSAKSNVR